MRLNQKAHNETTWQIIKLYSKSSKAGFKIEEIILFNYLLRCRLILLIELKCIKDRKPFKEKWLKNETNELASTAFQNQSIDKELYGDIKLFYEEIRSYLVHRLMIEPMDVTTFRNYDKLKGDIQSKLQKALGCEITIEKLK